MKLDYKKLPDLLPSCLEYSQLLDAAGYFGMPRDAARHAMGSLTMREIARDLPSIFARVFPRLVYGYTEQHKGVLIHE